MWSAVIAAACLLLLLVGCQQEMAKQPKFLSLEECSLFADGRSARPRVAETVARGNLEVELGLLEGTPSESVSAAATKADGVPVVNVVLAAPRPNMTKTAYFDAFPFPVTREVLEWGRERYTIYCAVCHDAQGTGDGVVVGRGYTRPPSYHVDRLREAPLGYLVDVITHGFGSMPDYAEQVPPRDRWAIVAYIRALQLSQYACVPELPEKERKAILIKLEEKRGD